MFLKKILTWQKKIYCQVFNKLYITGLRCYSFQVAVVIFYWKIFPWNKKHGVKYYRFKMLFYAFSLRTDPRTMESSTIRFYCPRNVKMKLTIWVAAYLLHILNIAMQLHLLIIFGFIFTCLKISTSITITFVYFLFLFLYRMLSNIGVKFVHYLHIQSWSTVVKQIRKTNQHNDLPWQK